MQKNVVPMFHVPDVRKTVEWYRDIGFAVMVTHHDDASGSSFAMLSFGAGEVMFTSGGRASPSHRREVDLYVHTDDVDGLHERLKSRVEVVEGPHNMFYGMRELIVRDLNGFWVTFGQEVAADVLTPWPSVDAELLRLYLGTYQSDAGSRVAITIQDGRLLAFSDDASGVFLRPDGEDAFTPAMPEEARVVFERSVGLISALTFEQHGKTVRFVRVS